MTKVSEPVEMPWKVTDNSVTFSTDRGVTCGDCFRNRGPACGETAGLLLDHLPDPREGPVDFFSADREWRRDADYPVVCLLTEHALVLQGLAVRAGWHSQFAADPKADSADFF